MVIKCRCMIYKEGKLRLRALAIKIKKVYTTSSVNLYHEIKKVCIVKLKVLCIKAFIIFRPLLLYILLAYLSKLAP